MKPMALLLVTLALGVSAASAIACPVSSPAGAVKAGGGHAQMACMRTTKLEVMGMECADCVHKVSEGLKAVKGVETVDVDLDQGVATVEYCSKDLKDTSLLLKAVEKAGYDAKLAQAAPVLPVTTH